MAANISPLEVPQLPALRLFLDLLPETISRSSRRTSATRPWPSGGSTTRAGAAIGLQCRDGHVVALALVIPLLGWSSHVGELRLVVEPQARGRGLGRVMARHALREAVGMGLTKLVVEVVAEQEGAVRMFDDLGFRGEALLSSYIRDRSGQLRDLLVLAHDVSDEWSAIASLGIPDELTTTPGR
jgi:ribosomal protein S18 acetylase RimI-like enzyme